MKQTIRSALAGHRLLTPQSSWLLALAVVVVASSQAIGQTVSVTKIDNEVVIPAGTAWNSPVRFGEVCRFDLAITYAEVFEVTTFETYEVYHITIKDEYRNLSSQLRFLDTADYYIRHDFTTGIAFHAGVFWSTLARRHHRLREVVRDVGTLYADWTADYPWSAMDLTGPDHDVNALPFGTLSYCDWAEGKFPR